MEIRSGGHSKDARTVHRQVTLMCLPTSCEHNHPQLPTNKQVPQSMNFPLRSFKDVPDRDKKKKKKKVSQCFDCLGSFLHKRKHDCFNVTGMNKMMKQNVAIEKTI